MPYIPLQERDARIEDIDVSTPGKLAYAITRLASRFLDEGANYERYALVLGVLQSVVLEFYRRRVAKYEDLKLYQNGDVP